MSVFRNNSEILLLEPCDGKLSCTVLRGESARKGADLPADSQYTLGSELTYSIIITVQCSDDLFLICIHQENLCPLLYQSLHIRIELLSRLNQ